MAKHKKHKKILLKKGTPLPGDRKYKFDSAFLKKKPAEERAERLEVRSPVDTKLICVPRQYLVFKAKVPRISPKVPRLK